MTPPLKRNAAFLIAIVALLSSCSGSPSAAFTLASPVLTKEIQTGFDSGLKASGRLPDEYSNGSPRSFPFTWTNLPAGTKALALVYDDPDAKPVLAARGTNEPTFYHWTATDLDPSQGGLTDDISLNGNLVQGSNDVGRIGYFGPAPPADVPAGRSGELVHAYRLTVWALSSPTGLEAGYLIPDLLASMEGKILGKAELIMSFSAR